MQEYRNPLLDSDWPDLDVTATDDGFALVASSFHSVPGLPVLHSTNLVDWRIVSRALARSTSTAPRRGPLPGTGVWAPAIRSHAGRLRIYWADPDDGIFTTSAPDATGPWTTPERVLAGPGIIDPCPFWDDDGRAWMIFAWAKSRSGIDNRLDLVELAPDGLSTIGDPAPLIDGARIDGCAVLEGPKLYRRDGWYWVFAPAGGVATGWQYAFRSRALAGPFEHRIVLRQGTTAVNGPHQGAWVSTRAGEDWFLHFQDRGVFGRVVHLQPMHWDDDGWPVIGAAGEPVGRHSVPAGLPPVRDESPATSDGWTDDAPGLQWSWQANSEASWARADAGRLHLAAVGGDAPLRSIPNVLSQPLPGRACRIDVALALRGGGPARGGLVVLGQRSLFVGLRRADDDTVELVGEIEGPRVGASEVLGRWPLDSDASVRVELRTDAEGRCTVVARAGDSETTLVRDWQATAGSWVAAHVGLFCTGGGTDATPSDAAILTVGPFRMSLDLRPAPPIDEDAVSRPSH